MLNVEVIAMIGVWWVVALVTCTVLMVAVALIALRASDRAGSQDGVKRRDPNQPRLPKAA
jgi:hypothetical protein